ncbi:hypothetical protein [Amycolatopsis sp. CA-230715]|uniref:hypothetical protein n=1 Tax=Amycolatopsis sp. CA-230715 TaxID=2745196 RepID=UPI0020B20105|nr:hypothetical protein [Amycolatopsis sp. CA-230715]
MRTRIVAASALALLAVLVSGCSGEAGPKPKPQAPDPGISGLKVKLEALVADTCYSKPGGQEPKGCEKYVTQLGGTAGTVHKQAGLAKNPKLDGFATDLDHGVEAYRAGGCTTVASAAPGPCVDSLTAIARSLREIKSTVDALPDA